MKPIFPVLAVCALLLTLSGFAYAGPLKTHVAEFNVTGTPGSEQLKTTLQGILASRLSREQTLLVEKPEQAEFQVIASYALFGRMFSLDVLIKSRGNDSLTKVFEQGEGQEDIIPAIGRLAKKIDAELAKKAGPAAAPLPVLNAGATPPSPAATQTAAKEIYVVRPESSATGSPDSWTSAPMDGVFIGIATGRILPSGERELFVASEHAIQAYRKGSELKPVAGITIPLPGKILTIDSADLDRDGTPELYVTIIDRESPASRVYQFDGAAFVMVADKLPWLFRGTGTDISSRTIYAQEMEPGGKFYGDVKVLTKSESLFTTKEPLKLPRTGNIFNFIRLNGTPGGGFYVVLDEDGYLVVYTPDGTEAWKSGEKYGGSENVFKYESHTHTRATGDLHRWTFLEQRITQLKDGTLLVPGNEGSFSFGNNRSFNKHTLFAFEWTGAVLKEKWHTRQAPSYLADYEFDQTSGELLLLEVVQKAGMFSKGKSVISIKRID